MDLFCGLDTIQHAGWRIIAPKHYGNLLRTSLYRYIRCPNPGLGDTVQYKEGFPLRGIWQSVYHHYSVAVPVSSVL